MIRMKLQIQVVKNYGWMAIWLGEENKIGSMTRRMSKLLSCKFGEKVRLGR